MSVKIFFFDCETTGLDSKLNAVHQLSGCLMVDGEIRETFNYRIKPFPGAVIDKRALEVSGITEEQIMEYPEEWVAYQGIVNMLGKYVDKYNKKDKIFLAGYNNASFDNQFFREIFNRRGDNYFGSWFWSSPLDLFVLASFKLMNKRHIMPDFKLKTVAEALGLQIDETKLHDALYDIELTVGIYKELMIMSNR